MIFARRAPRVRTGTGRRGPAADNKHSIKTLIYSNLHLNYTDLT